MQLHRSSLIVIGIKLILLVLLLVTALPAANAAQPSQTQPPIRLLLPIVGVPTAASSEELISQAEQAGRINADTAALYRVYSAFDDARLPAAYRGSDSTSSPSSLLYSVASNYRSLSANTQAQLASFFEPPSAAESWHDKTSAKLNNNPSADSVITWRTVTQPTSPIKVWYQQRYAATDAKLAQTIFDTLSNKVWPKLTTLMGEPMSDITQRNDGGDSKFDIYLVDSRTKTVPYRECQSTAAYLLQNRNSFNRSELAVEIMHAILYGYDVDSCEQYHWFKDATAVWAADYVYPNDQYEQRYQPYLAELLETPLPLMRKSTAASEGIKWRSHGRYIWPFYLARVKNQPQLIRTIWDRAETDNVLYAINSSIPGGFKAQWPEFAQEAWNRDPQSKFRTLDGLQKGALPLQSHEVRLNGEGQVTYPLPGMTYGLTSNYFYFDFKDDTVSSVLLENSLHDREDLPQFKVHSWVRLEGKTSWEPVEDITTQQYHSYCRDLVKERVAEMVVIVSNVDHMNIASEYKIDPLKVTASNIACRGWSGTVRYNYSYDEEDSEYTVNLSTAVNFRSVEPPAELVEQVGPMLMFKADGPLNTQAHFKGWIPDPESPGICTYDTRVQLAADLDNSAITIGLDGSRLYGGSGRLQPRDSVDSGSACVGELLDVPTHWWSTPYQPEERLKLEVSDDGRSFQGSYEDGSGGKYTWEFQAVPRE